MKKKISILLSALIAVSLMFGCVNSSIEDSPEKASNDNSYEYQEKTDKDEAGTGETQEVFVEQKADGVEMEIHFVDVGQGDCTFIDYGEFEALVDCGKSKYGDSVAEYIEPYVDGDLDLVIATHPDSDHIGGIEDIFDDFTVDTVIDSGIKKNTEVYEEYIEAVEEEAGCKLEYDEDMVINMDDEGDAKIRIIETGDSSSDANEVSVVAEVEYNEVSVLLTGDMGQKTEQANLSKFSEVDVLKVGHHGSSYSSSRGFINRVNPKYAIISAGAGNSYGHPSNETLEKLSDVGATVYQTMDNGTIVMKTDGNTYEFESKGTLKVTEPSDSSTYSAGDSGTSEIYSSSSYDSSYSDSNGGQDVSYISSGEYIANKNTGKFHYSYCQYVNRMSDENKIFYYDRNQALNAGYEPCKKCNP